MIYDLIIIGAGPAGLSAAIAAASQGLRTLLLEKMPSPARKLLISGTGQCNLTHSGSVNDLLEHYGSGDGSKSAKLDASRFLKPALHAYSNADLATFFVERSLNLVETEAGKIFPASRRSRDVLSLLLAELQRDRSGLKVEILKSEPVRQVIQTASDGLFSVETRTTALEGRSYLSKALIIATGGSSYPATGSSGDGYSLAASLGHRIQEPAPALVGIKVVRSAYAPFVSCSGFALQKASIKVYRGGKKFAENKGDVLFTHQGLSGPGILDLSRAMRSGDELRIPLANNLNKDAEGLRGTELESYFMGESAENGKRSLIRLLSTLGLSENASRALLQAQGIAGDLRASDLSREARKKLVRSLAIEEGQSFPIANLGSWEEAMATRGGIALQELEPKTMESRLVPGLFFAGEVLDIDGDTGGYNIQAAFSTGRLAALSAAKIIR